MADGAKMDLKIYIYQIDNEVILFMVITLQLENELSTALKETYALASDYRDQNRTSNLFFMLKVLKFITRRT